MHCTYQTCISRLQSSVVYGYIRKCTITSLDFSDHTWRYRLWPIENQKSRNGIVQNLHGHTETGQGSSFAAQVTVPRLRILFLLLSVPCETSCIISFYPSSNIPCFFVPSLSHCLSPNTTFPVLPALHLPRFLYHTPHLGTRARITHKTSSIKQ